MKKQKIVAFGVIGLSACMVGALAACDGGGGGTSDITTTPLAIPANISVTATDYTDVESFVVTFDPVENASQYYIYVYQEGDEQAKVTSTSTTTGELPNDLDAGDYLLSVVAVGNGITYTNSNGSEPVSFKLETWEVQPLGTVSDVSVEWPETGSGEMPTLSFTGVDSSYVQYYNVQFWKTDADGNKTEEEATTYFQIPASSSDTVSYTLTTEQYGDLSPSNYVVEIYARSTDSDRYTDGATVSYETVWIYGQYLTPEISVQYGYYHNYGPESARTTGVTIFVENYEDYFVGDVFTVEVYADEACTQLVTTATITYSSREMFGIAIINNYVSIDVEETLSLDTTYYFRVMIEGDGEVYLDSEWSEVVSFMATEENYQGSSGNEGGGFPGGPGEGGFPGGPGEGGGFPPM